MTESPEWSKKTPVTDGIKILLAAASGLALMATATLVASGLLSAPWRGKQVVRALGIPRPAIIAHRGASYLAPEGTLPAFLMARELGADYLEIDLQRTKDGILIALHDHDLSRTTDAAEVFPGREKDAIDTFTFAELQRLDAGSWFNRKFPERARRSFTGLRILRLEEVIEAAESGSHRPGLYIETKAAHLFPGIERQLVESLVDRGWIGRTGSVVGSRVIFQSFEPESLVRLKELVPQVPRTLLIDEIMVSKEGLDSLIRRAAELGAGIGTWGSRRAFGPHWSVEDAPRRYMTTWPWQTGMAHRAGLFVHPWTINDRWEMWMATLSGADGLFTDRTELALSLYGRTAHGDLEELWNRIGY